MIGPKIFLIILGSGSLTPIIGQLAEAISSGDSAKMVHAGITAGVLVVCIFEVWNALKVDRA